MLVLPENVGVVNPVLDEILFVLIWLIGMD